MCNENKIIWSLYDATGVWSEPYLEAGYTVRRFDLLTTGEDVRLILNPDEKLYGVLAAPPCTHLAGSGARYWKTKGERALIEALSMTDAVLRLVALHNPEFWALEQPVGRLVHYYGKPRLIFNPCDYGDPYTKKTCIYGKFNLPKKSPVEPVKARPGHHSIDEYWRIIKGETISNSNHFLRAARRSQTPDGFARAFFKANQ